jgi:hypothetical protein
MKSLGTAWSTTLSVKQIAGVFRTTAEGIFGTRGRRLLSHMPVVGGAGGGMEFFTPSAGDSPFDQFDEKAAFSVGVMGPQGGAVNGALPIAIHMYVYDEGASRRVEFVAPFDRLHVSKGKAEAHVDHFEEALLLADPDASRAE